MSADHPPTRVLLVGAGGMGRAWLRTLSARDDVTLAGVVDLDADAAARAADDWPRDEPVPVFTDPARGLDAGSVDLLVDVTVPAAHHPVTMAALQAGVPVLGEKPAAATLAEAVQLAAASARYEVPFVVSQNRRYEPHAQAVVASVPQIGVPGLVDVSFAKAPHFGGFREQMEHVLLVDMSIHHLDFLRAVLGDDPIVDVVCDEFNPSWSWYAGAAGVAAIFRTASGARATYTGSWCSPGLETSWNADWRISGPAGSIRWDGAGTPVLELPDRPGQEPAADGDRHGLAASLEAMLAHLRGGPVPPTTIADNVASLALVFAAIESAETVARVAIVDVLDRAREVAAATADDPALADAVRAVPLG